MIGGSIEGVAEPKLPFDVDGLGGECFVGERPVTAEGNAESPVCTIPNESA